jgi:hypothetical protein
MSPEEAAVAIVSTLTVFITVTVIVTVVAWQIFSTQRAKVSVAREEAYRELVEQSVEAIDRVTAQLERQSAQVADIQTRTVELERMLKEVE